MKKLAYFLVVLTVVLATGCGKKSLKDQVQGEWKMESLSGETPPSEIKMTFKDDTYSLTSGEETINSGTFEVAKDGKSMTIKPQEGETETFSNIKLEDGKLSFTDSSDDAVVLVKQK